MCENEKGAQKWMARTKTLIPISYTDSARAIYLTNYADMVVYGYGYGSDGAGTLYAARFGGYPEQAEAMAAAIYGGGTVDITVGETIYRLRTLAKRYTKKVSHDGVYAEVTMYASEDTETVPRQRKRKQNDVSKRDDEDEPENTYGADADEAENDGSDNGSDAAQNSGETDPAEQEAVTPEHPSVGIPPRGVCIYTASGDASALYDAIDRAVSVPLIPEFADWLIEELKRRGYLKPLRIMSVSAKLDAWILRCESGDKNIIAAVEDGLKSGMIAIPSSRALSLFTPPSPASAPSLAPSSRVSEQSEDTQSENTLQLSDSDTHTPINDVSTMTEYLTQFGPDIAERIKTLFTPMFDPESDKLSPEVLAVNEHIREKAGYSLYDAQLAVAEAMKRRLSSHKSGVIIAECGSGKTKIGLTAIAAAMTGLAANQKKRKQTKTFNLVICPAHITEKWMREINESLPDTFAGIVSSITGFDRLYSDYEKGGVKNCYAVISKENARDGYIRAPAVLWSTRKGAFICPDCGETVMMVISDGAAQYAVPSDQFFFKRENRYNHKCTYCGSMLWTTLNPYADNGKWVKVGGYGFVYAQKASEHFGKVKKPQFEDKIHSIMAGKYKTAGAHRKYPLSSYIKKKYRGRIDGLIVDELHDYLHDSGQGDAMAELYGVAKKVIGMTATLINGYASGIFHLLYRLVPSLMEKDGQSHSSPNSFATQYGVVQDVYIQDEGDYNTNRRTQRRKKSTKQLPGVSPLVYTRFLLEYAAFLSLSDMGKDLPEYDEIPVALELPLDIKKACDNMRDTLVEFMKKDKATAKRILSAYLNLLIAYPDQAYDQPQIIDPITGNVIVDPPDTGSIDTLMPKDKSVLDLADKKIAAGEKIIIYTNWTRLDTQRKLHKLLTEAGYRTAILPASVQPKNRERWVQARLDEGIHILISNPSLVQTGLDLNAFTTLIFYDTGYKLFTLRQAARRSYRINQTAPRVEVYMLYYIDTMQHKAMKLMGTKLAVASIIEGGFSEEGLAAMSQCEDLTTLMAKELMLGIRDSVEDVSSSFRKMADARRTQYGTAEQRTMPEQIGTQYHSTPELVAFVSCVNGGDHGGDLTYVNANTPVQTVEFTFTAMGTGTEINTEIKEEMETVSFDPSQASSTALRAKIKTRIPDGQLTIFDVLELSA
jgi:hypothetical protein